MNLIPRKRVGEHTTEWRASWIVIGRSWYEFPHSTTGEVYVHFTRIGFDLRHTSSDGNHIFSPSITLRRRGA